MIAIIFILAAFTLTTLYLFFFKDATIEIIPINGLMLGLTHYKDKFDESSTNYIDICLVFVIVSLVWES